MESGVGALTLIQQLVTQEISTIIIIQHVLVRKTIEVNYSKKKEIDLYLKNNMTCILAIWHILKI